MSQYKAEVGGDGQRTAEDVADGTKTALDDRMAQKKSEDRGGWHIVH